MSDIILEHTGIGSDVAFVGRGHFFQIWEPEKFEKYRLAARKRVAQLRKSLINAGGADG